MKHNSLMQNHAVIFSVKRAKILFAVLAKLVNFINSLSLEIVFIATFQYCSIRVRERQIVT